MNREVFLILVSGALGAAAGSAVQGLVAQQSIPYTQTDSMAINIGTTAQNQIQNWVKNNMYPELQTKYGYNPDNINPCTINQRLRIVWHQANNQCRARAMLDVDLPGTWVAGNPQ